MKRSLALTATSFALAGATLLGGASAAFAGPPKGPGDKIAPKPAPAAPVVSVADLSLAEGTGGQTVAHVVVSLDKPAPQWANVVVVWTDSTAVSPDDFTDGLTEIAFNPGEQVHELLVPIVADAQIEADEVFTVQLSAPLSATLGDAHGTVTIVDDDFLQAEPAGGDAVDPGPQADPAPAPAAPTEAPSTTEAPASTSTAPPTSVTARPATKASTDATGTAAGATAAAAQRHGSNLLVVVLGAAALVCLLAIALVVRTTRRRA